MTLAKAVLSGTVYRAPEKRFTSNNIPVAFFTLNIDEKDETLVRVVAKGNLADTVESSVSKSDKVVVEGRLQNATIQADDGTERKIVEVELSSFELIASSQTSTSKKSSNEEIVKFAEEDFSDDLIGEDEIPF